MNNVKYKNAGFLYLIGTFFNKGISIITIPLFTRILSQNDYGIINTLLAWSSIFTIIIGLALHMGLRSAFTNENEKVEDVLSTITLFCTFLFLFFLLLVKVISVFNALYINEYKCYLVLIISYSNAVIGYYNMYLMMKVKYIQRSVLLIFPSLIITVLSIFLILIFEKFNNFWGRLLPFAIINMGITMVVIFKIAITHGLHFKKNNLIDSLRISAPLILHGLSLSVLSQSDRLMITYFDSSSNTAIYSIMYNLGVILTLFYTALDGVWIPWFTQKMKDKKYNEINLYGNYYLQFMSYVAFVIMFLSPEIIKILTPEKYWDGVTLVPPILISSIVILMYTLIVNIEHFIKKTGIIAVNTVIAASTNIILNFILIPKLGFSIAAYTTLFSYLVSFGSHSLYLRKIKFQIFKLYDFSISLFVLIISSFVFIYIRDFFVVRILFVFILSIIVFILKKDLILKAFSTLKNK